MQSLILALLLCAILALLSTRVREAIRLPRRSAMVFAGPAVLTLVFWLALWSQGIRSPAPVALIAVYTFAPSLLAYAQHAKPVTWIDFAIILLLWLPIELTVGEHLIPKPLQGFVHSVAYGIAILLALWLFLIFRQLPGMKYNPPRGRDLLAPLIGYAIVAPILIAAGLWLSFIRPFHVPPQLSAGFLLTRFLLILVATAFPEEILFRALIQNAIMQRLGFTNGALLLAAIIFGCAHLNNGPGPLPNWKYGILAAIAGFAYGKVFQKSSSVFSSAILHALVNTSKHVFF